MKKMWLVLRGRRGAALILAVAVLALAVISGTALLTLSNTALSTSLVEQKSEQAYFIAKSVIQSIVAAIQSSNAEMAPVLLGLEEKGKGAVAKIAEGLFPVYSDSTAPSGRYSATVTLLSDPTLDTQKPPETGDIVDPGGTEQELENPRVYAVEVTGYYQAESYSIRAQINGIKEQEVKLTTKTTGGGSGGGGGTGTGDGQFVLTGGGGNQGGWGDANHFLTGGVIEGDVLWEGDLTYLNANGNSKPTLINGSLYVKGKFDQPKNNPDWLAQGGLKDLWFGQADTHQEGDLASLRIHVPGSFVCFMNTAIGEVGKGVTVGKLYADVPLDQREPMPAFSDAPTVKQGSVVGMANVYLKQGSTVYGDVHCQGGALEPGSTVKGDLYLTSSVPNHVFSIQGTVEGNVYSTGMVVELGYGCQIKGNIYSAWVTQSTSENVTVEGKIYCDQLTGWSALPYEPLGDTVIPPTRVISQETDFPNTQESFSQDCPQGTASTSGALITAGGSIPIKELNKLGQELVFNTAAGDIHLDLTGADTLELSSLTIEGAHRVILHLKDGGSVHVDGQSGSSYVGKLSPTDPDDDVRLYVYGESEQSVFYSNAKKAKAYKMKAHIMLPNGSCYINYDERGGSPTNHVDTVLIGSINAANIKINLNDKSTNVSTNHIVFIKPDSDIFTTTAQWGNRPAQGGGSTGGGGTGGGSTGEPEHTVVTEVTVTTSYTCSPDNVHYYGLSAGSKPKEVAP